MKKQLVILSGIAGLALILSVWSYASSAGQEIRACASKNGALQLIGNGFKNSKCDKNEKLVTWNQQGEPGQKGDKGDKGDVGEKGEKGDKGDIGQTGTSSPQLHIVDGNGQDLGILVSRGEGEQDDFNTYLPSLGAFIRLLNSFNIMNSYFAPEGVQLYYEQPNCQGNPFTGMHGGIYAVRKAESNPTYWMYDLSQTPQNKESKSRRDNTVCVNTTETILNAVYLKQVSLPFSEPLVWPLKVESL